MTVRTLLPLSFAALLAACPPSKTGTTTCTGSSVACNGACVVVATDPKNCGACGTACPTGQSCAAGACACPSGQTACGDLCSITSTDALNCGACGKACFTGELCQGGLCVCETVRTPCAGRCVDVTSDVSNCGACGTACTGTQVCSNSACAAYCAGQDGGAPADAGILDCGGSCVDSLTDPVNCGGCGQGCQPGGLCAGGACTCGTGETACDAGCFDLGQSQQNCGTCGTACAAYQTCENGACAGPDLYVSCSDYNFTTSNSNSIVGINSLTGAVQLPAQVVSAPPPDGGTAVEAQIAWTLFTDSRTLWVLDTTNSQIDVLDVLTWPATVKGTVAVGTSPDQLLVCGGYVIVTNSIDNTVQGIDPTTLLTVGEVSLGAGENPTYAACDGVSTLYIADWQAGDIKSIDLSKPNWKVGQTLAVPTADTAVLADGGFAQPTPNGIAFAQTDGGGELLVSLENLDFSNGYAPAGPATVLVIDPKLAGVQSTINPGVACENGQVLTLSGSQLLETCTGTFFSGATSGVLAPIDLIGNTVGSLVTVPLANPDATAYLKNGLVAVGDEASGSVAIWNPADGGVVVLTPCPTLQDGGQVPSEVIGAVVGAL